ncbi:RNA polymerase subunit sigma-24 [Verrucomicrobia bacterium]|jgi:hypothetical protein|nr:RNA polymerase subunit sigma-24 [Verrucomicrobiota bacterium]MDB4746491.1 RNA polymerase subunit sigma-24 [Verrucomicrobiota bacterium]
MKKMIYFKPFLGVFLVSCLVMLQPEASAADVHSLARIGRSLSSEEIVKLEKHLETDVSDLNARVKLLGYYSGKHIRSSEIRKIRQQHLLWLIEHAPESEVLGSPYGSLSHHGDGEAYYQAKRILLAKIRDEPDNLALLKNGSKFFTLNDRSQSIEFLQKGESLDKANPFWPKNIGQAHLLNTQGESSLKQQRIEAANALAAFQRAHEISTEMGKGSILVSLAKSAFIANELDLASEYSKELIKGGGAGWNSGNRIHYGNIFLGRVALLRDDIDSAKAHLISAGKTTGSPQLNSFGPDMTLARELLKVDENGVVLEYFELCRKFWLHHRDKLDDWKVLVEGGRVPDFGRGYF